MTDAPILRSWRVSGRSFARRSIAYIVLTVPFFWLVVPTAPLYVWLAAALFWGVFLTWVAGDFDIWLRNRSTRWMLTPNDIRWEDPRVPDNAGVVPLREIKSINRRPLWSLVLRLTNGQAHVLPLPPEPRSLRAAILSARDAIVMEETHETS